MTKKPHFASPAEALKTMAADLRGQVDALQAEIAATREHLEEIDDGSLPKTEFIANVHQWVDREAKAFGKDAAYRLSALRLARPRPGDVSLLQLPIRGGGAPEVIAAADANGLLCWLFGDALKARAETAIEALNYQDGPPLAERGKLRVDLRAKLDALELEEERLIEEAAQSHILIPRRPDARPEIILALPEEVPDAA